MSVSLIKIEKFLQSELKIAIYEKIDKALNGVQVSKKGDIERLCLAVDFCEETLERAILEKADAILVHHGIYWGRAFAIRGRYYRLIKKLIMHNIALIAVHLPLDMHEQWGNNIALIEELSLDYSHRFGDYHGLQALFMAKTRIPVTLGNLVGDYRDRLGEPLCVLGDLKKILNCVAVCSGGGLFGLEDAKNNGADVLLTGDANHTVYHLAKELDIAVISGGHYFSETLGVKRLGQHLEDVFSLKTFFFDCPTGL